MSASEARRDSAAAAWVARAIALSVLAVSPALARVAPNPLPAYESLVSPPHRVLRDVGDLIGTRWVKEDARSGSAEAYVWDIAYVRHPDGRIFVMRHELQTPEGALVELTSGLEDHPKGSVELHVLADVHGFDVVVFTDAEGVVRHVPASAVRPGAVGGGGRIFDGGSFIVGGGACYLAPVYDCELYSFACHGSLIGSPCVSAPPWGCTCALVWPGTHQSCSWSLVGHECMSRSCSGTCVSPCVCEEGTADDDDDDDNPSPADP